MSHDSLGESRRPMAGEAGDRQGLQQECKFSLFPNSVGFTVNILTALPSGSSQPASFFQEILGHLNRDGGANCFVFLLSQHSASGSQLGELVKPPALDISTLKFPFFILSPSSLDLHALSVLTFKTLSSSHLHTSKNLNPQISSPNSMLSSFLMV